MIGRVQDSSAGQVKARVHHKVRAIPILATLLKLQV